MDDLFLSLRDVQVTFNRSRSFLNKKLQLVLNNINLEIYRNDKVAIIGRNGAGKSTLLNLMAGIIKPDDGEVKNLGYNVNLLALQAGFNNELSAKDNIILSGLLLKIPLKLIKSKIEKILHFAELSELASAPVRTFSSGMKARLGFAIASNLKSDLILIDETFSVGDARFKMKSQKVMDEWLKADQTFVLVSHQTEIIKKYCNKVYWLEEGKVFKVGEPKSVIEEFEIHICKFPSKFKSRIKV